MKKQLLVQNLEEEQDILISTKPRPIWQKILAAVLYTIVGICIYIFCTTFIPNMIEMASIFFVLAVRFSLKKIIILI